MSYPIHIRENAERLRRDGFSVPEIATRLGVSKNTAWHWVKDVELSKQTIQLLAERSESGRKRGRVSLASIRIAEARIRNQIAEETITKFAFSETLEFWRLMAAVMFWCEGGKRELTSLRFTNSDPSLVKAFLRALRTGFDIDESKFRIVLHLHGYHNDQLQRQFWSEATGISVRQFSRSYLKPNSGARKREGYPGCASIRYNDASLARTLDALYHAFANKIGM